MRIFAFKANEDLAKLLDALPNRSEFIRLAVLERFGMACPTCHGTGSASSSSPPVAPPSSKSRKNRGGPG